MTCSSTGTRQGWLYWARATSTDVSTGAAAAVPGKGTARTGGLAARPPSQVQFERGRVPATGMQQEPGTQPLARIPGTLKVMQQGPGERAKIATPQPQGISAPGCRTALPGWS